MRVRRPVVPQDGLPAFVDLYRMGFRPEDAVIDVGWRLRCSKCGHKGAETRPDWSTKPWRSGETGA